MKLTKIIATLGPSSNTPNIIEDLIDAGIDVVRLNFSHGTHDFHQRTFDIVRETAKKKEKHIAVLQDLSGPKIRIGKIEGEGLIIKEGDSLILTQEIEDQGQNNKVFVNYASLPLEVKVGEKLLLADGAFVVEVSDIKGQDVCTKVLHGGKLTSNKGLNLPYTKLSQSALTPKDVEDVRFGLKMGVDFVALSFVRSAQDIVELRAIMKAEGSVVPIIAKIEKPEALKEIDKILEVTDGIMIARGDLAIETPMEQVPFVQKELIRKARKHGKPVIVATQMLESMIKEELPTRAEVTDVSGAVLDGADAVMLSAETASGLHPVKVVKQMVKIVTEAESHSGHLRNIDDFSEVPVLSPSNLEHSVAIAVASMSQSLSAKVILAPTMTGRTPELISRLRLFRPILTLCPNEKVLRKMALFYGVKAVGLVKQAEHFSELLEVCQSEAFKTGWLQKGDYMIVTSGHPVSRAGETNLIKAIQI